MKARLLAGLIVAALSCGVAFAQQTDKQGAQTEPKDTKTVTGAEEKAARSGESAKDQPGASKPEEQMPAQGTANQSSDDNTPRQGDRMPEPNN
jgi:hypothetical protein